MNVTEMDRDDGIRILKLAGRMDLDGADVIRKQLSAATSGHGVRVIMDLAEVNFMSSIGIGMIVRTATAVQKQHGNMVLLDPQPVVWMALEKTHIPEIISVHLRLEDALVAVRGEPLKPGNATA
jgi:anti-sigma B factor antagonist